MSATASAGTEWVGSWMERPPIDYPFTLSLMQNPLTKTAVRIDAPVEVTSDAEMGAVYNRFLAYCKIAWQPVPADDPGARLDPEVISAAWLKRVPE